ncbi:MAG: FAD:protein FMN transferase [Phycisphaerales bacterium JB061]
MTTNSNTPDGGQVGLRLALDAMGTRFELLIADAGNESELRAVGEEALECIADWHNRLSAFDAGSVVSAINAAAGERAVRVDRDMLDLLQACKAWHADSGGAFDIAIGSLMKHHGFRGGAPADTQTPAFGMGHLEIDEAESAVFLSHPDVRLDFGAVAKGWAIDEACELMREAGIASALLHGGSSTARAIGSRPDGQPWRIKVCADEHAPIVLLSDASFSVSAPSGRLNDNQEGHVLDPRSGLPANCAGFAAAVVYSAAESDAWSTALLVLGERPGSMRAEIASILHGTHSAQTEWSIEGESAPRVIADPKRDLEKGT